MAPQQVFAYREPESPHLTAHGDEPVPYTWNPVNGGMVSLVAGSRNITAAFIILAGAGTLSGILTTAGIPGALSFVQLTVFTGAAVLMLIRGLITLIGGSYAVHRRLWPMARDGAVCTLIPSQMTTVGVMGIVFITGKKEFS